MGATGDIVSSLAKLGIQAGTEELAALPGQLSSSGQFLQGWKPRGCYQPPTKCERPRRRRALQRRGCRWGSLRALCRVRNGLYGSGTVLTAGHADRRGNARQGGQGASSEALRRGSGLAAEREALEKEHRKTVAAAKKLHAAQVRHQKEFLRSIGVPDLSPEEVAERARRRPSASVSG